MDFAYMVVQFPFLSLDINNTFLAIQPYRSVAIALVVVSLTLLLVQRIRSTNREHAALHGEMLETLIARIQQLLVPASACNQPSGWSAGHGIPAGSRSGRRLLSAAAVLLRRPGSAPMLIGDVSGSREPAAAMTAGHACWARRKAVRTTRPPSCSRTSIAFLKPAALAGLQPAFARISIPPAM